MRLNQFEFIMALNIYGSFSKTAEELLISQPAISRAIKELEDELGYDILIRGKKGVVFTPKGAMVLEKATLIMDGVKGIREIGVVVDGELRERVRIGSGSHHCSTIVLDSMMDLKEKYPGLITHIVRGDNRQIVLEVAANELDIGVIQLNTVTEPSLLVELQKNNLTFTELFNDEMCFILSPNHPLASVGKVKMSEILQYPFVSGSSRNNEIMVNFFKQYGYREDIININDIGSHRRFVAKSKAVGAIPHSTALESNRTFQDDLVIMSIADYDWRCSFGWIHKTHKLSLAEEEIIEAIKSYCQRYQ